MRSIYELLFNEEDIYLRKEIWSDDPNKLIPDFDSIFEDDDEEKDSWDNNKDVRRLAYYEPHIYGDIRKASRALIVNEEDITDLIEVSEAETIKSILEQTVDKYATDIRDYTPLAIIFI